MECTSQNSSGGGGEIMRRQGEKNFSDFWVWPSKVRRKGKHQLRENDSEHVEPELNSNGQSQGAKDDPLEIMHGKKIICSKLEKKRGGGAVIAIPDSTKGGEGEINQTA